MTGAPMPEGNLSGRLSERIREWKVTIECRPARFSRPFTVEATGIIADVIRRMADAGPAPVVMPTGKVLLDAGRGWVAIDPKGVWGGRVRTRRQPS